MHKSGGFTIVEIIVVCIAISILASMVAVGWGATLKLSRDNIRETEQRDWTKRFENYRQRYTIYPDTDNTGTAIANGTYCLGTGFPGGRCKLTIGGTAENAANPVMTQLAKIGTLPDYKHTAVGGYSGPWAEYIAGTPALIRIYQVYERGDCPDSMTKDTGITGVTACYQQLTKN